MSRPQVKEYNAETGEEIIRDMTDEEVANLEAFRAKVEAVAEAKKQDELKKQVAEAKLTALGLTTDDLKVLGLA